MRNYLHIVITVFNLLIAYNSLAQTELSEETVTKSEISFTVSPTPFDDQVTINIQHKNVSITSVRIFDAIMSKEIAHVDVQNPSRSGSTSVTIHLPADLKPGVYFCILYSNKDIVETKRLLKAAY